MVFAGEEQARSELLKTVSAVVVGGRARGGAVMLTPQLVERWLGVGAVVRRRLPPWPLWEAGEALSDS